MLELDGSIWFRSGTQTWGGKNRIDLLAQIDATGSITNAARAVGMSYKGAWDAIDAMNNLAGEPLVIRAAGGKGRGGTQLAPRPGSLRGAAASRVHYDRVPVVARRADLLRLRGA